MLALVAEQAKPQEPSMALMRPDQANPGASRPETIEELFEALESPLLNYTLRLVGERSLAEDIVQEAFMRLHKHFAEVREPRRWVYRTAHNLALNSRRTTDRIVPLVSDTEERAQTEEPADPQPFPDEQIARWEGIGLVRLSLESLDERSRELIRLKFHEDLSYKQISAKTGLTVGHVGYLLHHAIKTVAEELTKNGMLP
jgi:RNA polymerase sigma-70 factor (ECF subfamily)